jgi:hypothetical protein
MQIDYFLEFAFLPSNFIGPLFNLQYKQVSVTTSRDLAHCDGIELQWFIILAPCKMKRHTACVKAY